MHANISVALRPPIPERGASHICEYICRGEAFGRGCKSYIDNYSAQMLRPCKSEMHPS